MPMAFVDRNGLPVRLTVAIPAFNEEMSLEDVVTDVLGTLRGIPGLVHEVLIIDDGSTDGTGGIAERLCRGHAGVRVHTHPRNQGFAAAQRSCFQEAGQEWVAVLPADHQVRAESLRAFLPLCRNADLILPIRNLRVDDLASDLVSQAYYSMLEWVFGIKYRDFGSCIMCRRSLFLAADLKSRSAVLITELLVKAIRVGAGVAAVEMFCYPRRRGNSKRTQTLRKALVVLDDVRRLYAEVTDPQHPFRLDPCDFRARSVGKAAGPASGQPGRVIPSPAGTAPGRGRNRRKRRDPAAS